MSGYFDFIRNNLSHVAPILIAAAFALAIIGERSIALFKLYAIKDTQGFFDKLQELILAGKVADAIAFCDRFNEKPVAKVVKQGLLRSHQPESLIEHGLQLAVADATLLGLLGTIAGLIASFEAVGHADAQQKSALLAAGISTAMNATMLGLGVAIPCMVAYSFLMNRSNRIIGDIEQAAIRTMDLLKQRYYAAETSLLNDTLDKNEAGKVVSLHKTA